MQAEMSTRINFLEGQISDLKQKLGNLLHGNHLNLLT